MIDGLRGVSYDWQLTVPHILSTSSIMTLARIRSVLIWSTKLVCEKYSSVVPEENPTPEPTEQPLPKPTEKPVPKPVQPPVPVPTVPLDTDKDKKDEKPAPTKKPVIEP